MTRRKIGKGSKPPAPRNPVARALRLTRPRIVTKATTYSRKRLPRPHPDDA